MARKIFHHIFFYYLVRCCCCVMFLSSFSLSLLLALCVDRFCVCVCLLHRYPITYLKEKGFLLWCSEKLISESNGQSVGVKWTGEYYDKWQLENCESSEIDRSLEGNWILLGRYCAVGSQAKCWFVGKMQGTWRKKLEMHWKIDQIRVNQKRC